MTDQKNYVAIAMHEGVIHLCIDNEHTAHSPSSSLCRKHTLQPPKAAIDPIDVGSIHNFIVCKLCEMRFELMGYRAFYAIQQAPTLGNTDGQMNLL